MKFKYQILKDKGLLIQNWSEEFSVDELQIHIQTLIQHPDWNSVTKALTDTRGLNTRIVFNHFDQLKNIRSLIQKTEYKHVFLVDHPLSTASICHFKTKTKEDGYDYDFFSTPEYAIHALNIQGHNQTVLKVLNELYTKKEEVWDTKKQVNTTHCFDLAQ